MLYFFYTMVLMTNNKSGGVPERLIGAVLKTVVRDERTVGSNPTSSFVLIRGVKPLFCKVLGIKLNEKYH